MHSNRRRIYKPKAVTRRHVIFSPDCWPKPQMIPIFSGGSRVWKLQTAGWISHNKGLIGRRRSPRKISMSRLPVATFFFGAVNIDKPTRSPKQLHYAIPTIPIWRSFGHR